MPSPFNDLRDPSAVVIEDVEGQFDCLEVINGRRCNGYTRAAKYIPSERLLTWKCPEGHISKLEDVDDD